MANFVEFQFSGKSLQEIYNESCKKYGCKKNSAICAMLSSAPEDYDAIHEIDLSSNVVGSRGVLALLNVVAMCRSLTSLSLKGNSLDNRAIQELVQVARNHRSLTRIDVSHNRIGTAGKAILDLLRQNNRILEVKLDNTYIDVYMLKRINERLVANRMAASVAHLSPYKGAASPADPLAPSATPGPTSEDEPTSTAPAPGPAPGQPSAAATAAPTQAATSSTALYSDAGDPAGESLLQQPWWEHAVPFQSGSVFPAASASPEQVGQDFDWLGFDVTALFDPSRYHSFLPIATKLLQLRTVERPPTIPDDRRLSFLLDSGSSSEGSSGSDNEEEEEEEEEEAEEAEGRRLRWGAGEDDLSSVLSELELDLDLESLSLLEEEGPEAPEQLAAEADELVSIGGFV
eukprot:EG_transcript_14136